VHQWDGDGQNGSTQPSRLLDARLQKIEAFVQKRLQDIRGLLFAGMPRAKAELSKHCTVIPLTSKGSTFRIAGDWNLLGGLSDDAGGPRRTEHANSSSA